MRIVAGEYKGRVITSPSEKTTRPTTDRVRESIFSSVYSRIADLSDISVLDAFAGSGALGIEALSRGARHCTFIEQDRQARKVLEDNISSLGISAAYVSVIAGDAFAKAAVPLPGAPFGLALFDPPYAYGADHVYDLLTALVDHACLASGCIVVYEHALANTQDVADEFGLDPRFAITGRKKYGKIGVTYLKYQESGC